MDSVMKRVDKARKLKVRFVGEADGGLLYTVKGREEYTVLLRGDGVSCSCPDYQYRSVNADYSFICKHLWAVLMEFTQRGGGWSI